MQDEPGRQLLFGVEAHVDDIACMPVVRREQDVAAANLGRGHTAQIHRDARGTAHALVRGRPRLCTPRTVVIRPSSAS